MGRKSDAYMCWEEEAVQGSSEAVLFLGSLPVAGISVAELRVHCPAWAEEAEWEMQECKVEKWIMVGQKGPSCLVTTKAERAKCRPGVEVGELARKECDAPGGGRIGNMWKRWLMLEA